MITKEAAWTFLEAQAGNDFLVGGVVLASLGMAIAGLRYGYGLADRLFWRLCAWSVTVDNRHEAYDKLLRWLSETGAFKRLRRFRLDALSGARDAEAEEEDAAGSGAVLTPDSGSYWFFRDGALALVGRRIDDKPIPGRLDRRETLTLTLIAPGRGAGQAIFRRWLAAAEAHARSERALWPKLHSLGSWGGWSGPTRIRPRPLATVITAEGAGGALLEDARVFLGREEWYVARGIPWRRGYLLYGPPGTGKSSLIRAIVSELGLDLAVVDLTGKSLTDAALRDALSDAPIKAALVLEDVDAAFSGRERGDAAEGLTFSGLLNALDGLAAQEGRIVFMTTNHRERLDPALIRPGRADRHVALGLAGPKAAAALYARFFPEERDRIAAIAEGLAGEASPAAIQAALLAYGEAPAAAEKAVSALFSRREGGAARFAAE